MSLTIHLDAENVVVNKTDINLPAFVELKFWWNDTDTKQIIWFLQKMSNMGRSWERV